MAEFERCTDSLCPRRGKHAHVAGAPPIRTLFSVKFTNERGRRIKVDIERGEPGHIVIRLTGPDTISENIVTVTEAYHLMHGLNAALPR